MNKKILLVGWGFPPKIDGGLDIHVKHLFEELLSRGVSVDLALPEENAPKRDNVIGLNVGEGDMVWKARELSSKVAEIASDYDIVHTHDWFGAEAGFKARKYCNVEWVSTIHSSTAGRSRNHGEGEVRNLERLAVTEPDKCISVSRKLSKEVKEEYNKKPEVVHNGFSQPGNSGFDPKKELDIDGDMFFFVGRHAEQKGIEHLIYGFKKYLENEEATLVVGGDGEMKESLEKFTEMLKIDENVIFPGFISSEKLGDYYSAADVFVSPSINEPFGLTISEALESSTPVVATESGISEIVSGDIITEVESNSDSIAEGLKQAISIEDSFDVDSRTWTEMTNEIVDIYSSL
jgi:glycosyltransferase involved in cell wall biosynthesis